MKIIIPWISFYCLALFSSLYSQEPSRSICLIVREDFLGEREFARRVKIACTRLNWKIKIQNVSTCKSAERDYDWILTLVPGKRCSAREKDYLVLFDPEHHFFNYEGHLEKKYHNYAGYLTTFDKTQLLLEDIKYTQKLYPRRWYPTAQYRAYKKVEPTRLFSFIGHWGNRLDDLRYQILQKELAKKSYTNFFGHPYLGSVYGDAFKGAIKFDGESVIEKISEMGVCLILHSKTHLKHGIPSGRIFEAVAASAVIISDLNPFIIENFGDSVFYFNQDLSGEEMFQQIDSHMIWIQEHPEEALMMAQRAHQIFEDKFLLESQLLDFDKFHRSNL